MRVFVAIAVLALVGPAYAQGMRMQPGERGPRSDARRRGGIEQKLDQILNRLERLEQRMNAKDGHHKMDGHKMSGHQMSGHKMGGHKMDGCKMGGHKMGSHDMRGCKMGDHNMGGHKMGGHGMRGHDMRGCKMSGHQMGGHQMGGHKMGSHDMRGCKMSGHKMGGHAMGGHKMDGCKMGDHKMGGHGMGGHEGPHHARGESRSDAGPMIAQFRRLMQAAHKGDPRARKMLGRMYMAIGKMLKSGKQPHHAKKKMFTMVQEAEKAAVMRLVAPHTTPALTNRERIFVYADPVTAGNKRRAAAIKLMKVDSPVQYERVARAKRIAELRAKALQLQIEIEQLKMQLAK